MKNNSLWGELAKVKDGVTAALGTIVFGAMTANSLQGIALFKDWFPADVAVTLQWRVLSTLITSALLIYCFAKLYEHRQVFQSVRGLRQQKCGRGYQGLVLLFSPSNKEFEICQDGGQFLTVNKVSLSGENIRQDIEALNQLTGYNRWNWQHLLRGLEPHIYSLGAVYLIVPKGITNDSSTPDKAAADVEKIIRRYTHKTPHINTYPEFVDYEDFSELQKAILAGLKIIGQDYKIDEENTIIDITGGYKTSSIAGAAVTLDRSVAFQYVQTSPPFDVLEYDLVTRSPVTV